MSEPDRELTIQMLIEFFKERGMTFEEVKDILDETKKQYALPTRLKVVDFYSVLDWLKADIVRFFYAKLTSWKY